MSNEAPKVTVVHFADPWCFWSWSLEPLLQRLRAVYGSSLAVVYRMAGMAKDFREWQTTYEVDDQGTIDWVTRAAATTGHPQNPRYMLDSGLSESYRSCRAVKAAERQDVHKAEHYFRRLMEVFQIEARPPVDDTFAAAAVDVGLDPGALVADIDTAASTEAFMADRQAMRVARANFLALVVSAGDKSAVRSGVFASAPYEQLIDQMAPGLEKRRPDDILAYLAGMRGHFVHTREIAEVFDIKDADAETRLTTLHREGLVERRSFDFASYWVPLAADAPAAPPSAARVP
jgi:protein-disulfide isomerase-like protein with CxxC motif